jgi:hypothetical protein
MRRSDRVHIASTNLKSDTQKRRAHDMARPTKLTTTRHERIINLLRDDVPFATACREVGISASAGYEWLYRGWGTRIRIGRRRRPTSRSLGTSTRSSRADSPRGTTTNTSLRRLRAAKEQRIRSVQARPGTSRRMRRLRSLRTGAKQVRLQGFRSFRSRERGLRRWRSRSKSDTNEVHSARQQAALAGSLRFRL